MDSNVENGEVRDKKVIDRETADGENVNREEKLLQEIRESAECLEIPESLQPEQIRQRLETQKGRKCKNHFRLTTAIAAAALVLLCMGTGAYLGILFPTTDHTSEETVQMAEMAWELEEAAEETAEESVAEEEAETERQTDDKAEEVETEGRTEITEETEEAEKEEAEEKETVQEDTAGVRTESRTDALNESTDENMSLTYSGADTVNQYNTVEALLQDAQALVKVKVLQADSENTRSYIYTIYTVEIRAVLYGDITETQIKVNMPGGIITGEAAQEMISEVTEGKDAGDLSDIGDIVSDGGTDRLLEAGDEAYLFLIRESDTAYKVVGEYNGEVLLENENVYFDNSIVGFGDGASSYAFSNTGMPEADFLDAMEGMISNID